MMTKIAHIRENRKNNKGFSLVELIIVIAIMVALIAVMGPQYVKYVQKSRDSAIASAAEDFEAYIKTAIADPDTNLTVTGDADCVIGVSCVGGALKVVKISGAFSTTDTTIGSDLSKLATAAGANVDQSMGKSNNGYKITITHGTNPTVKLAGETIQADYTAG